MRFGIQTGQQHRSYDEILSLWRTAERTGFSTAWLYDHLIPIGGALDGNVFEAYTMLSSLLARTSSIRGGVLVTCVMYREPTVLAKMAATVDHVSNGRLEFGIGSCWNFWEADQYGLPFPGLAERYERLNEAIEVISATWSGTAFEGRFYKQSAAAVAPAPVQRPRPPIWVGGNGKRIGPVAARYADGWNSIFMTFDEYREHLTMVENACTSAGRDPATLRRSFGQRVVVEPTYEAAEERARQMYEPHGATFDDYVRDRVFFGAPSDVAEKIAPFRDAGVEEFILWHEPPMDDPRAEEQIEAFAETVAPLL
ncbi:MAG: LLM class flavin-dependent oxidoreductase [Actinomycetota bacterium]